MRVVIDTNLLVTYLISHRDPMATIIDDHLAQGDFAMLSSPELLAELDRALSYPRLQKFYDKDTRLRFVALIAQLAEMQNLPGEIPAISRDPDDDKFIACAIAGRADFLVSGDQDLLTLERVGDVRIITARELLEILTAFKS
ncbi:MAG: putative toxin-antitoxin system toxin component, PIN family [Anaerolineae bacterium]|jgi:putative PIN family toxin of toxin-antitoxin system|nr:putative toxin-antitoxin system toxin component, PIN family [Anaerolineae bacterium]